MRPKLTNRCLKGGRRKPSPENLTKLAAALEKRGGEIQRLADELRKVGENE